MNQKKGLSHRIAAIAMAVMMILTALPFTAFAAPASNIPEEMLDNSILRALEYTGYDVQAQKNNGTIYQSGYYGSRLATNAPNILSNISYGLSMSGKETVNDGSTITGLAPNIARFEQSGLCCASFVTYFICNYLPNIEGVDTSLVANAVKATGLNSQAVVTWQNALNKLSDEGKIEKVGTSSSNVDYSRLVPGDIIIFGNSTNSHVHAAIYAGTYKGTHFIIHVGNERTRKFPRWKLWDTPATAIKLHSQMVFIICRRTTSQTMEPLRCTKRAIPARRLQARFFLL